MNEQLLFLTRMVNAVVNEVKFVGKDAVGNIAETIYVVSIDSTAPVFSDFIPTTWTQPVVSTIRIQVIT